MAETKEAAPPLAQAALDRDLERVRQLVSQGAELEQRTDAGLTPLLISAATDQYDMALFLVREGADIFAADDMGATAGAYAAVRPFPEGTEQGRVQAEFLEVLEARGFPMPPPRPAAVRKLRETGQWPPLRAGEAAPVGAN
ncbi:MAG TPA: hypothetical protein PKC77_15930 [Sphingopyxis sp.]|nr:hypothetical protein [Sphingopyxis sp.]